MRNCVGVLSYSPGKETERNSFLKKPEDIGPALKNAHTGEKP
jgi:hypothetical protein